MRVVVVEDNAELQYLVRFHLADEGLSVVVVGDDWASLLEHDAWEGVDVAVVDLNLSDPHINGATVLRWLKENRPAVRRIVFTASLLPQDLPDVPELQELGVFVSKLETPGSLIRAVKG